MNKLTKLQQLIKELCPNGVEQKTLGAICQIVRGASPRPIKSYITSKENGVPWIKIGDVSTGAKYVTFTEEYITEEGAQKSRKVYKGDFILSNSMSFGRPYILKIDGCIHDGWLSISGFQELLLPDFLYYILSSSLIQREMAKKASFGGAVQNLNADIVRGIAIPVPPLPVQEEIVRILDELTEKTDELISELNAELDERKKQYEYFQNQLFANSEDMQYVDVPLGDVIVSLKTGLNPRKNFKLNTPDSCCPYITGKDIFNNKVNVTARTDEITMNAVALINKRACIETDDLLFASTGTGTVGRMAIVEDYKGDWSISESIYAIKVNQDIVLPQFLMYLLYTENVMSQYKPKITKASVPHLKVADLLKVKISIPSIQDQKRIIKTAETFTVTQDLLISNLMHEIENRKKQYEYYRDKLLTF